MHRKISMITLAAGLLLMSGCSSDPTPDEGVAAKYKATKMAVTPIEQRLEIDGCLVMVSRVTTAKSDLLSDFTVAVAKCPTATVASTTHNCGRGCNATNVVVQPGGPETSAPGTGDSSDQGAAGQSNAREQELRAEVQRLSAKLTSIQQAAQP